MSNFVAMHNLRHPYHCYIMKWSFAMTQLTKGNLIRGCNKTRRFKSVCVRFCLYLWQTVFQDDMSTWKNGCVLYNIYFLGGSQFFRVTPTTSQPLRCFCKETYNWTRPNRIRDGPRVGQKLVNSLQQIIWHVYYQIWLICLVAPGGIFECCFFFWGGQLVWKNPWWQSCLWSYYQPGSWKWKLKVFCLQRGFVSFGSRTLQGTNISRLGKRKIIFKSQKCLGMGYVSSQEGKRLEVLSSDFRTC